jgi:WD40 repeat protein
MELIHYPLLQDYSLRCTMTGHKSTVSCLAVASGILYSGSWDGTIRSWWLTDHSPLSVLEDDTPGSMAPVLSIGTEANFVVSSYENGCLKVLLSLYHESRYRLVLHSNHMLCYNVSLH